MSRWPGRTWRLHSLTKRAMPTSKKETFHSKLVTLYTWRFHQWEAPRDLRSKENWYQDMSVPSKLWIAREKSDLSIWATAAAIRCAQHVSRVLAQEVLMSSGRADTDGTTRSRRRSIVQREANQNSRYSRASDSRWSHHDVQSTVESSHWRWSYLGAWRRSQSRLPRALSQCFWISGVRFFLRG
jgi:hypothetical protein